MSLDVSNSGFNISRFGWNSSSLKHLLITMALVTGVLLSVSNAAVAQVENVLYSLAGPPDGSNPGAGLVLVNGNVYGTTGFGGSANLGTVFKVTSIYRKIKNLFPQHGSRTFVCRPHARRESFVMNFEDAQQFWPRYSAIRRLSSARYRPGGTVTEMTAQEGKD